MRVKAWADIVESIENDKIAVELIGPAERSAWDDMTGYEPPEVIYAWPAYKVKIYYDDEEIGVANCWQVVGYITDQYNLDGSVRNCTCTEWQQCRSDSEFDGACGDNMDDTPIEVVAHYVGLQCDFEDHDFLEALKLLSDFCAEVAPKIREPYEDIKDFVRNAKIEWLDDTLTVGIAYEWGLWWAVLDSHEEQAVIMIEPNTDADNLQDLLGDPEVIEWIEKLIIKRIKDTFNSLNARNNQL